MGCTKRNAAKLQCQADVLTLHSENYQCFCHDRHGLRLRLIWDPLSLVGCTRNWSSGYSLQLDADVVDIL